MRRIAVLVFLFMPVLVYAKDKLACEFQSAELKFGGSPLEQANCLLRPVGLSANIKPAKAAIPGPFADIVGQKVDLSVAALSAHLKKNNLSETDLGGSLSAGLSRAHGGSASAPMARYFVIHDTSTEIRGSGYPKDDSTALNNMDGYTKKKDPVAHVFVNRLGESKTGHDFNVPWRATRLESKQVGIPAKGLFLHIELIQPRLTNKKLSSQPFAIAPVPGFTDAQYRRLALLYTAASVRSGSWMIPAFHAVLDVDLKGHDDPQNFDMGKFAGAVEDLRKAVAGA